MNSEARRSCHGWIVDLSFRTSRPEGERQGSIHGARKSQTDGSEDCAGMLGAVTGRDVVENQPASHSR